VAAADAWNNAVAPLISARPASIQQIFINLHRHAQDSVPPELASGAVLSAFSGFRHGRGKRGEDVGPEAGLGDFLLFSDALVSVCIAGMSSPTNAPAIIEVIPYADISSVRGQDARVLLRKFHAAVVKADEGGTACDLGRLTLH